MYSGGCSCGALPLSGGNSKLDILTAPLVWSLFPTTFPEIFPITVLVTFPIVAWPPVQASSMISRRFVQQHISSMIESRFFLVIVYILTTLSGRLFTVPILIFLILEMGELKLLHHLDFKGNVESQNNKKKYKVKLNDYVIIIRILRIRKLSFSCYEKVKTPI